MPEELVAATQTAEQTAPSTGQGGEQAAVETPQTGSEAQTNTEESQTDSKMIQIPADKWREANQAKRELRDLRTRLETPGDTATKAPANSTASASEDPAMQAIELIADKVYEKMSPILGAQQTQQALEDIAQKPYAAELEKEIVEMFDDPRVKNLPTKDRLSTAYALAVSENLPQLVNRTSEQARTQGQDDAYNKISEKQSGGVQSGGASQTREGTTEITEEVLDNMTPAEYARRRVELMESIAGYKPRR